MTIGYFILCLNFNTECSLWINTKEKERPIFLVEDNSKCLYEHICRDYFKVSETIFKDFNISHIDERFSITITI